MTLNWGILGAAKFALGHMGPAIHAAKGNVLAALATSDLAKAAPFQSFAPGIDVFSDYEALLASDKVDAVYIPLPNHMHVDWTLKAIQAGKHVLCEKPIALSAEDIDRLIAARDEAGVMVAEAFMITHHPQWLKVREVLGEGRIGDLVHVDVTFSFNNPDRTNIRNRPETGGGGVPDIGVYAYGSARFATGAEPRELSARLRYENGVDTFAHVVGEMEGGGHRFTYSGITSTRMANRQDMVFHGTKGTITLRAPFNAGVFDVACVELRIGSEIELFRWPQVNQYVEQVEAFSRSATEGAAYACPLEFSRGTQAMIDMVFANGTEI